jgi:hypothetical protein
MVAEAEQSPVTEPVGARMLHPLPCWFSHETISTVVETAFAHMCQELCAMGSEG